VYLRRRVERQRRRAVDDDVGPFKRTRQVVGLADVAKDEANPVAAVRVVEVGDVDDRRVVAAREDAPDEIDAEESRTAGDQPAHRRYPRPGAVPLKR